MPTSRDFADSIRRPLDVAQEAMEQDDDELAQAAAIRATQQSALIAWVNASDPDRKARLDEIVDRLSRMLTPTERARVDAALQLNGDFDEALEHPEDSQEDGGMCADEPVCEAIAYHDKYKYQAHSEDCPAWAGLQIKEAREKIDQLQDLTKKKLRESSTE